MSLSAISKYFLKISRQLLYHSLGREYIKYGGIESIYRGPR